MSAIEGNSSPYVKLDATKENKIQIYKKTLEQIAKRCLLQQQMCVESFLSVETQPERGAIVVKCKKMDRAELRHWVDRIVFQLDVTEEVDVVEALKKLERVPIKKKSSRCIIL